MNCKDCVFSRPDKIKDTLVESFYWVIDPKLLAKVSPFLSKTWEIRWFKRFSSSSKGSYWFLSCISSQICSYIIIWSEIVLKQHGCKPKLILWKKISSLLHLLSAKGSKPMDVLLQLKKKTGKAMCVLLFNVLMDVLVQLKK